MISLDHQMRATLNRLLTIYKETSSALNESVDQLQAELDALERPANHRSQSLPNRFGSPFPAVDRRSMCVVYRNHRCFLGNTLMLKFMEQLVQRPNEYFNYDELLVKVWHARRQPSSIRSVVKEVKKRLREANMGDLADAIDGRVSGHYGLILDLSS